MGDKISAWIISLFTVGMIAGCIIVPLPRGQEVYTSEYDIKEFIDNAARRDEVIKKLGRPARQYESDISYRVCRKGGGVFIIDFILDAGHTVRSETKCYELILHFDGDDHLTSYEKILFDAPYSNAFKTPHGEAMPTIRAMAEKGIPESQWRLYNEYGRKPEDIIWLCRSADNGYAKAQLHVGHLYWSATDIPQNQIKSYVWYKLAATGDRLQGLLPDEKTRNQAVLAKQDAQNELTTEQLTEAEYLYADWKQGDCELELLPEITGN